MTDTIPDLNAKLSLARLKLAELDGQRSEYALAAHTGSDVALVHQGADFAYAAKHGSNPNEAAALVTVNEKRAAVLNAIDELSVALGRAEQIAGIRNPGAKGAA
jgi:hypothetical protein